MFYFCYLTDSQSRKRRLKQNREGGGCWNFTCEQNYCLLIVNWNYQLRISYNIIELLISTIRYVGSLLLNWTRRYDIRRSTDHCDQPRPASSVIEWSTRILRFDGDSTHRRLPDPIENCSSSSSADLSVVSNYSASFYFLFSYFYLWVCTTIEKG